MTKVIHNKKWFYYLRKKKADPNRICLENHYGLDKLKTGLVVCQKTTYILFTYFDNLDCFLDYMDLTPHHLRSFYETIVLRTQKPHFDVDIDLKKAPKDINDQEVVRDLIRAIKTVMSDFNVNFDPIKDILLFHSNGENKKSYHIVIDHHYHKDNVEAFCFYEKVLEHMSPSNALYIDNSVYKTVQQFRMLGSKKYKTDRTKEYIVRGSYTPKNLHQHSLVSYIEGSELLPEFGDDEEDFEYENDDGRQILGNDLVMDAMNMLETYLGISKTSPEFPFIYDTTSDPFIILKRVRPSMCELCSRVHENENPYMFVSKYGLLYFDCRRTTSGKKKMLGRIRNYANKEDEVTKVLLSSAPVTLEPKISPLKILSKPESSFKNEVPPTHDPYALDSMGYTANEQIVPVTSLPKTSTVAKRSLLTQNSKKRSHPGPPAQSTPLRGPLVPTSRERGERSTIKIGNRNFTIIRNRHFESNGIEGCVNEIENDILESLISFSKKTVHQIRRSTKK